MDDDTENTGAPNAADAMNGLSVYDPAALQKALTAYQTVANDQKTYYDNLRNEILARRAGPSASERLYQLGAALMAPTTVRGFSGTMNNVLPVLQQQAQASREGTENRAEALSKLEQAQLAARQGLIGKELDTQVALARIAKQGAGVGQTYDQTRGIFANRNNPRPTENTYTIKGTQRTLVQWQDGLWREALPSGGYKVFERAGNTFNELQPEGAR